MTIKSGKQCSSAPSVLGNLTLQEIRKSVYICWSHMWDTVTHCTNTSLQALYELGFHAFYLPTSRLTGRLSGECILAVSRQFYLQSCSGRESLQQQIWSEVAQSLSIAVPRAHSTLGDCMFSIASPRAWINLPPHIRHVSSMDVSSMDVFSKNLKSFLFSRAL